MDFQRTPKECQRVLKDSLGFPMDSPKILEDFQCMPEEYPLGFPMDSLWILNGF